MAIKHLFLNIKEADKKEAVEKLISSSYPSRDFYLMVILSVAMATAGLLLDDASVVIGSMLIAPVLYPILSTSMGIVMNDAEVLSTSFTSLVKAVFYALVSSFVVTILFGTKFNVVSSAEIITRTAPSLLHATVAIIAGMAASFSLLKPKLASALPGIAVSVALVPPLAVTGIGLATGSIFIVQGSFLLFLVNSLGVVFTSMIVFSLANLSRKKKVAEKTLKKEAKEEKKIEKK